MDESIKKKQIEESKPKQKICFDVVANAIVQTEVRYRVWAFDANEAANLVKNGNVLPIHVASPKIGRNMLTSLNVFLMGTINKVLSVKLK